MGSVRNVALFVGIFEIVTFLIDANFLLIHIYIYIYIYSRSVGDQMQQWHWISSALYFHLWKKCWDWSITDKDLSYIKGITAAVTRVILILMEGVLVGLLNTTWSLVWKNSKCASPNGGQKWWHKSIRQRTAEAEVAWKHDAEDNFWFEWGGSEKEGVENCTMKSIIICIPGQCCWRSLKTSR